MTRVTLGIVAALALAAAFPAAPAHAQNGSLTRSFVSSSGVDSNPCTITQPCVTFAKAYTAVGANGIVAALDPGKYGPITITGPVTVNGNGWAAITGLAAGSAITINAGSGNVTLTGLELDGAGASYNGIVFNSGGSLTVTDCVVENFISSGPPTTGNGILMQPTSGTFSFAIINTKTSNNQYVGVYYFPPTNNSTETANGVIDHVIATNNGFGISIFTEASASISISNSIASSNSGGITIDGLSSLAVSIDNSNMSNNGWGIFNSGSPKVLLGRSVITSNSTYGIDNEMSPSTFYTYQNNQINLNGNSNTVGGSPLIALSFQ
jgi:hypothetical protein